MVSSSSGKDMRFSSSKSWVRLPVRSPMKPFSLIGRIPDSDSGGASSSLAGAASYSPFV